MSERVNMRDVRLDILRGLAIVLMIADHVLFLLAQDVDGVHWLRLLTRPALPLFMGVAGYLWSARGGPRVARLLAIAGAAVVTFPLSLALGMKVPDVLASYVAAAVLAPLVLREPILFAALGFLVAWNVPVLRSWAYSPAYVVGFCALGVLAHRIERGGGVVYEEGCLNRWGRVLAAVGRRPMAYFVGHLGLLFVIWKIALGR